MKSFDNNEFEKYKVETEEKYGHTSTYKEHIEKTKHYSKEKWNNLLELMNDIFGEFAVCMKNNETTDSITVQNLVKMLQEHISENYYNCTKEILASLGKMYVLDERFKNNIDKHASGTASYVSQAIEIYCNK